MKVIISGGGTGGHIYPALAIAQGLTERAQAEILYLGGKDSLESRLVALNGLNFAPVESAGLIRRFPDILTALAVNLRGIGQAKRIIKEFKPDLVIGTGGFAAAPVVYGASALGIPTLIHEQNAYPGQANRFLSSRVDRVCLSFEAAGKYFPKKARLIFTGLPVRKSIIEADSEYAKNKLGLDPSRPVFLVTGGSQGAKTINEAVIPAVSRLLAEGIQIIHLCGAKNQQGVAGRYEEQGLLDQRGLILLSYSDDMENILAAADLALARAGASFIAEALVRALPTVLVPYPYAAGNHQEENAKALMEQKAAVIIKDCDLNRDRLLETVLPILQDKNILKEMSANSQSLAKPQALDEIIKEALQLASRKK